MQRSSVGLIWMLPVLVLAGCKSRSPAEEEARRIEEARAKAVEEAEQEEALGPAGYVVTEEKLDAFLQYQRRMLELNVALVRETQKLMGRSDGGVVTARKAADVLAEKGKREEALRNELKLSQTDVRMLGLISTEIASRRSLAKSLRLEDAIQELEDAKARLGPDRQKELEKQIAELRGQEEELVKLRDAREKWGDANVDRVLTREAELTKNYQDMLSQFSAPTSVPRPVVPVIDAGVAAPKSDAGT